MTQPQTASEPHRDYEGAKFGMWLFLLTEILLFGGMFLLYAVYRAKYSAAFHTGAAELNTFAGALNTVILLTSSLTIALSIVALKKDKTGLSMILQASTILMAFAFLVNKYFEWSDKFHHGIYPGSPELLEYSRGEVLFYNLYFVMIGLHGFHVVVGVILLSIILVMTQKKIIDSTDFIKLENSGLYWHLVDVIWIYLFPLFYLIS